MWWVLCWLNSEPVAPFVWPSSCLSAPHTTCWLCLSCARWGESCSVRPYILSPQCPEEERRTLPGSALLRIRMLLSPQIPRKASFEFTWFKLRHAHFWPFFPGQFPCRKWFRLLISKLHVWQTHGMTLKDLDQYSRLYQILHLLFQYWIFSCVLLPLLSRNTIHGKLKLTTYLIDVMSNFVKEKS